MRSLLLRGHQFLHQTVGPWTPAALGASLALWLDADDAASITLNGSTVSQWNDKSGNSRHVRQSTAAKQPTYITNALNGKKILGFDGNRSLFALPSSITLPQPYTRAIAAQFLMKTNLSVIVDSESTNIQNVFYNGEAGSSNWVVANGSSPSSFTNFPYGISDFSNHQHFHEINQENSKWGIDGSTPVLAPNSPGPQWQTGFRVGNIRTEFFPNYGFQGHVYEIILINGVLTAENRQRLEGYIAHKWNLEANLPVDHPYKSAPPTV